MSRTQAACSTTSPLVVQTSRPCLHSCLAICYTSCIRGSERSCRARCFPGELCVPKKNSMPVKDRPGVESGTEFLPAERCLAIHRVMVRARAMEERMIKMSKSGEGYFWIGGPGEEAFNASLGMQIRKGEGPKYDFLLLKYRGSAVMIAMGMDPLDNVRQMAMTATDPFSMGRNF